MKEVYVKGQRFLKTEGWSSKQVYKNRIKAQHRAAKEIIQTLMLSPIYWQCPVNQRVEIIIKHLTV